MRNELRALAAAVLGIGILAGCGGGQVQGPAEGSLRNNPNLIPTPEMSHMFSSNGISLFGNSAGANGVTNGGQGIGVNAYLWRGALDTLKFMPLASADPFGGVIITDWYQPMAASGERFKATAYILGRQLRADGIRISVFRQVQQNGGWVDAPVSPSTASELEDKVLEAARELRAQSASN